MFGLLSDDTSDLDAKSLHTYRANVHTSYKVSAIIGRSSKDRKPKLRLAIAVAIAHTLLLTYKVILLDRLGLR